MTNLNERPLAELDEIASTHSDRVAVETFLDAKAIRDGIACPPQEGSQTAPWKRPRGEASVSPAAGITDRAVRLEQRLADAAVMIEAAEYKLKMGTGFTDRDDDCPKYLEEVYATLDVAAQAILEAQELEIVREHGWRFRHLRRTPEAITAELQR